MKNLLCDWGKEFLDLELGDKRLYGRLVKIMDFLSSTPNQSILLASGSRTMAKATYRFLSNENVTEAELLGSISSATSEKLKQLGDTNVLCVQDTTSVSFGTRKKIQGMGYYCDSQQKGMNVHTCIAVTQDGLPIGILHQQFDTREKRKDSTMFWEDKKFRPIEEKESYRWLQTLTSVKTCLPKETNCIHICDREGDFYELFQLAKTKKETFLVRMVQNRTTADGKKIMNELKQTPAKGEMIIQMGRNPKEKIPSRTIKMNVTYGTFELKRPKRRKEETLDATLKVSGIYVYESGAGEKGVHWFLITNQEIQTLEKAVEQVRNYTQRWKIERFHYVLKSGCCIEEKQTRSYEKLKVLTILYSVVAMRIMNLTYIGRLFPEIACDILLEEEEWKILYCMVKRTTQTPKECYSLKEAILYLGELGGYKRAPSDGIPGAKVLWIGLQKLMTVIQYRGFIV